MKITLYDVRLARYLLAFLSTIVLEAAAKAPAASHLYGVWEGIATAEIDGRVWHEYVAFEFQKGGAMNMANARESKAVSGTWVAEENGLLLTIPGRPPATLDQLQVASDRLEARLGYGEGRAVDIVLTPVRDPGKPPKLPTNRRVSAADITFDGVKLGQSMLSFYRHRLYAAPCDDDALPKHKLRVVVYAATPCRDRVFTENTSFVVFTDLDEKNPKDQAIRTVAWLGGSYFDSRSNFPLRLGTAMRTKRRRKQLAASLGQTVERTMTLQRQTVVTVTTLTGAIHLLDDGKRLIGVVLGPMPSSTDNELWSGIMQMWEKYTLQQER